MGAYTHLFLERFIKEVIFHTKFFYTLLVVYFTVLTSFACLYFVLSFHGVLLLEDGELKRLSPFETLAHSFYFSGVTLMTVGYGDITPIGWGRLLALLEALIGYILPPAFFLLRFGKEMIDVTSSF